MIGSLAGGFGSEVARRLLAGEQDSPIPEDLTLIQAELIKFKMKNYAAEEEAQLLRWPLIAAVGGGVAGVATLYFLVTGLKR